MGAVRLGRKHPLIRRLRALRRNAAERRAQGVFIAEGLHAVDEALRAGADLECAVVAPALERDPRGRALRARLRATLHEVDDALMQTLQDARTAQPVLAVVRRPAVDDAPPRTLAVVLAGVQDPGNVGAVLRTAEAAGADAFWTCGGADPYHPRAVRASQGSIFRLPPREGDAVRVLDALGAAAVRRLGADAGEGASLWTLDWPTPLALVLGGEGGGLDGQVRARLDGLLRVPMRAPVESLSVGAAAAAILFERARTLSRFPDG